MSSFKKMPPKTPQKLSFFELVVMKFDPRFPRLHIVDHPLVQHKLSLMRDKRTSTRDFRELLTELAI